MSPMPPFTVQDIVRATQGALVAGDLGIPVTGVSIDSRSLGVGEAFFAIQVIAWTVTCSWPMPPRAAPPAS